MSVAEKISRRAQHARSAGRDELASLLHDAPEEVLAALLENPHLDEPHLILMLERRSLPGAVLESVARTPQWMRSYPVKLRVATHPRTPRRIAMPLVKQLYLFDLVNASLQPAVPAELKRIAEDLIIARLGQLPLGQKLTLARRGSARVVGALLAEGVEPVVPLALDSAFLTESQVLKVLSHDAAPARVVEAVARHARWSHFYNVRLALVRNPQTPLARVLSFLPDMTKRDLKELSAARTLSPSLRQYLLLEVASRGRPARNRA